jgi:casein kinase I family protein HRR25
VVKLESVKGKNPTLDHEFGVYTKLSRGIGIPRIHWFGTESGFDAMVIERLGPSLDNLFVQCRSRFSLKTVLLLAGQLVSNIFNAVT